MTKKNLHKFFEGTASLKEEMAIRQWLEASESNKNEFFRARANYDAICLNIDKQQVAVKHKTILPVHIWSVAASVAIIISFIFFSGKYSIISKDAMYTGINSITVPAGQRVKLTLSDSSVVWLNSLTYFEYPAVFSNDERLVQLDGEAYFEVKGNENCPFIVSTEKGDVKVTGTKFNVKAYTSDNHFETALLEGKVEIIPENIKAKSIVLKPNQRGLLVDNKLVVDTITDSHDYLWRDGIISFKNKTIDEIFEKFEQNYGVKIILNDRSGKAFKHAYTGKFRTSDGMEYNLKMLQKSVHFNYERIEENQIIYIK